jgi:hypothetical protein
MVRIAEVANPRAHRGDGELAAQGVGVHPEDECAGESDPVCGPAAAIFEEVGCLGAAGGRERAGNVVGTTDKAGVSCAGVLRGEGRVGVPWDKVYE